VIIKKYFCIFNKIQLEFKWRSIYKKLNGINLLFLDVDGVLTDGGLWIDQHGNTTKRFDVKDGLGLKLLQNNGIQIVLVSGGFSGATEKRAKQLGIKYYFVEVKDKFQVVKDFQKKYGFLIADTAYIGDDINDSVVRPIVNLLFTPSDASIYLQKKADIILQSKGGNGAIRELSERFLLAKNSLSKFTKNGWVQRND